MGKLQEIKDQVAREYGYKDWEDRSNYCIRFTEHDATLDEVSSRFAKAVAEDALNRAADENKDMALDAYESILSTEINLDL